MNILALDSYGEMLSVGVGINIGDNNKKEIPKHPYKACSGVKCQNNGLISLTIDSGYKHAERVMGAIDFCLSESELKKEDIDLFACAGGPGSFTGLRIGLATIKGLALGLQKPFVTVPTLDAIAYSWRGTSQIIVPIIDAKRSHYYFAIYNNDKLIYGPFDDDINKLFALVDQFPEVLFVGPDADLIESSISERPGFHIAECHRSSCVNGLINLAHDIYLKDGSANSNSGLSYIRKSDAEEAALKTKHSKTDKEEMGS